MLSLLWPQYCLRCEAPTEDVLCPQCGPNRARRIRLKVQGIHATVSLGGYHQALGNVVRAAKYAPSLHLAWWLGQQIAITAPTAIRRKIASVVPVPSHWTRRIRRGFEPATVLATPLARSLGAPIMHALRSHARTKQASLSAAARLKAPDIRCVRSLSGRVVLVDDVVTTGATASRCARELLSAGASEVWLVAACHVDPTKVRSF
jgi:competence protein ComFC